MVFVTREAIFGAYIAGQMCDEASARRQLQSLYPFLRFWVRRLLAKREERETHYLQLDPRSDGFLAADKRNFFVPNTQVMDITVSRGRSLMWGGVGKLKVDDATGRSRKFVLISQQDTDAIAEMLRPFFPGIKLIGEQSERVN